MREVGRDRSEVLGIRYALEVLFRTLFEQSDAVTSLRAFADSFMLQHAILLALYFGPVPFDTRGFVNALMKARDKIPVGLHTVDGFHAFYGFAVAARAARLTKKKVSDKTNGIFCRTPTRMAHNDRFAISDIESAISQSRLSPAPMSPRSVMGQREGSRSLTLWAHAQWLAKRKRQTLHKAILRLESESTQSSTASMSRPLNRTSTSRDRWGPGRRHQSCKTTRS